MAKYGPVVLNSSCAKVDSHKYSPYYQMMVNPGLNRLDIAEFIWSTTDWPTELGLKNNQSEALCFCQNYNLAEVLEKVSSIPGLPTMIRRLEG